MIAALAGLARKCRTHRQRARPSVFPPEMSVPRFGLSHHRHPPTVIQARQIVQPRRGANQPESRSGFSSPCQEPHVESARLHIRLAISMSHRRDGGLMHPSSTGCTQRWRGRFESSTAFPRNSNLRYTWSFTWPRHVPRFNTSGRNFKTACHLTFLATWTSTTQYHNGQPLRRHTRGRCCQRDPD